MKLAFCPPPPKTFRRLALAMALSAALPAMAQYDQIDLGGAQSIATGVNAEGNIIIFNSIDFEAQSQAFQQKNGVTEALDAVKSAAMAINALGDVVVGSVDQGLGLRAVRWKNGVLERLGGTGDPTWATAVNASGDVIVGIQMSGGSMRSFRWTEQSGSMSSLDGLSPGANVLAQGVNAAGDVVVGAAVSANNRWRAFRWTEDTYVAEDLGVLISYRDSYATGVDASGDIIVGYVEDDVRAQAFRWSSTTNEMEPLGWLHGGGISYARAVNADGSVVVGEARDPRPNSTELSAFRWTHATGMQSVEEWLAANGVTVDPSVRTKAAKAVNADGSVVVGQLDDGSAFIARVPVVTPTPDDDSGSNGGGSNSGGGSGLINVAQYGASLANAVNTTMLPLRDADMVMHGAHGSPMETVLADGQGSVRVAGDWGRTDRDGVDSRQQSGELSLGRGLSSRLQARVALGTTRGSSALDLGGNARQDGIYLLPELTWQALPGMYATLSAYYNEGSTRVRRAYLNAGTPDTSVGETDVRTAAVLVRLDWKDLWNWKGVGFTPYTSYTASRAKMDAYSESGGGFAASWDAREDKDAVLRIGLDSAWTLPGDVRLTGRLEGGYRPGSRAPTTASGQVIGLTDFEVQGTDAPRRSWARLGLGVDLPVGPGRVSTTVNATTQGGAPAWWLYASYRMVF